MTSWWRHYCVFWICPWNLPKTTYRNETWQRGSPFKVPQNMQIWKPCDKKLLHNDVIINNNGKQWEMRTSVKPNKFYINRKVLMRAIQKCTSYWIWATISKVVGIFVKFWHFLRCPLTKYDHITWPKKQIWKIFCFVLILHLILGKVTKFQVGKLSTSEVISQKPDRGGGGGGGKRVKDHFHEITCTSTWAI